MTEKPLYQDEQLRIDYLPTSVDDHVLFIKDHSGEERQYIIQRGILRDMARAQRGTLERMIGTFNHMLLFALRKEDIGIDSLHVAVCQAYAEEEERVRLFHESFERERV